MSDEKIINYPLEIPFKDFMPGQVIQSGQFNDDMAEIEEKVNEVVEKHNILANETYNHVSNKDNPHEVTAKQVGTYSEEEIDTYLDDIRNGGLYDKSIENRVLDDECVEARNIKNASITSIKVDSNFGSQINISKNIDITDRYTKKEVNDLLVQKVGEGTYSKEELDQMFEDVQAGQIVDGTIDVSKLKDNVGKNLDISANPSITDRYTKAEVNILIQENGLPRDWGGLDEIAQRQHYGELPIANVMTADEFVVPLTPVLDIDVKEVIEARGDNSSLNERFTSLEGYKNLLVMPEPSTNHITNTNNLQALLDKAGKNGSIEIVFPPGEYSLTTVNIKSNTHIKLHKDTIITHKVTSALNPNTNTQYNLSPLFMNAKAFDNDSNNITGYNGNGNITIEGGTIMASCALCFIHGENILFKNIKFLNAESDHVAQIGACRNVRFENCYFNGVRPPSSSRNYVELIQIDAMTYSALPYWVEGSPVYDETPNDIFEVYNCKFIPDTNGNYVIPTAIGSHGTINVKNKNITIRNCEIQGYSYAGITLKNMENVYIENSTFSTSEDTNGINGNLSDNIYLRSCLFDGGRRIGIFTNCNNVDVKDIFATNMVGASAQYFMIAESYDVRLNNITFKNCTTAQALILLRNVVNVCCNYIVDTNNDATLGCVIRLTTKDSGVCDNIRLTNIVSEKSAETHSTDVTNIVDIETAIRQLLN